MFKKYIKNILLLLVFGFYFFFYFTYIKGKTFLIYGIDINNYSSLISYFNTIIIVFTSFVFISIIENLLIKSLTNIFKKTKNKIDDLIIEFLSKVIKYIKYLISIYIGLKIIILPESIKSNINKAFSALTILVIIILITHFIKIFFSKYLKKKLKNPVVKHFSPFVKKILIFLVWVTGIITIATNLGYNLSAIIAGAGIGGLAFALAAQKSITNIFGTITIILNKSFKIGDIIKIGGFKGTVTEIGLTSMRLKDLSGHDIIVPNEKAISNGIENLSKKETRKESFTIGVTYDTSSAKLREAKKLIAEIMEKYIKNKGVESYRSHFNSFGDFSLNIDITYFSLKLDFVEYLDQKEEINLAILEGFEKASIDMAFPTQEIIIKK